MNKTKLSLLLGAVSWQCYAQVSVNSSGINSANTGESISFSVGQITTTTITNTSGSISQGVQQPYTITSVPVVLPFRFAQVPEMSLYPNPTNDFINLTLDYTVESKFVYKLVNIAGKEEFSGNIIQQTTNLSLVDLPVAIYFLNIYSENQLIKSFQIIKN